MVFNKNEGLPEHFSNSNVYIPSYVESSPSVLMNSMYMNMRPNSSKNPVSNKMNVKNLHDKH
jgi:hypothetical protein